MGRQKKASTEVIGWIERECRVPEGRYVGQPIKLRKWQREWLKEIYDKPTRRAIISMARKNGKGLDLATPIPTPDGWRAIGDLRAGDYVYGSDGKPTRVRHVSQVHYGLRCWRLTFSDSSQIVADEQHRWLTKHAYRPWVQARINGSGNGGRWHEDVVKTPQIAESVYRPRNDGVREHNHKICVAGAIQGAHKELPVDPYVLGVWLGDGTSEGASFTCDESDLVHLRSELESALEGPMTVARYSGRSPTVRASWTGLQASLRQLGLLGDKHIPDDYQSASESQRWDLLQGLMDTDGTVHKHGGETTARCSFTSSNPVLARDVWRLCRTLGLKATHRIADSKLNGRVVGEKHEVSFTACHGEPVFRLPRKAKLLPESRSSRSRTLSITECEEVETRPTVCISVEAEDSLFLAGNGCVPTHNTAISACLLLAHLVGPRHKTNSQLYSTAQSRDQAALVFSLAAKMVRLNPNFSAFINVVDSAKKLVCDELGTMYRALSAEASTAYGLSPSFVIHDELGQVRGPRSELYEAMETAVGAQEAPLSVCISTQAASDNDLFSILIDDAQSGEDDQTRLFLYSAPDDLDPFSEQAWKAANPGYGDILNKDAVKEQAESARRMPSREASYRNLVLNQRVEANNPFVTETVWRKNGGDPREDWDGLPVYGGLDLSSTRDLTSLVLCAQDGENVHVSPYFWLPEQGLREKSVEDRVPYDQWRDSGHLLTTPGNAVEYSHIAHWIVDFVEDLNIRKIAFDRWGLRHLRPWLIEAGMSEERIDELFVEFGQGFRDISPALRDLEASLLNGKIRHGDHPVLNMCTINATVKMDEAGNRKLDKKKSTRRIDGLVALTMAHGVMPIQEEAQGPSVYEERGMVTI